MSSNTNTTPTFNLTFNLVGINKQDVENPPYIEIKIEKENVEVKVVGMLKETAEMVKKKITEVIKDYFEGRGDLGKLLKELYSIMEDVVIDEGWSEWYINLKVETDIDEYDHEVKVILYLR